ncbi:MAG: KpsF/GutQ family sugar-phosphate isomerase [Planctomycetota bacterium]|nr:KpsF/GutQ family sugar-phosphate isomerase [Planctomycetota bacterium]MCZ6493606.1 KpsF/GutQ family sugar-phosphate isomerase [Planctomycetota bacterium]MCZ6543782.1 KpsF/GutQ family sugar-phosphate isomerase [Planctomycetota bacterium]MCZ6734475.1 KpsF/GutQ family sugar-phosphate isomerase [Planctomycetota bacterium]MCZ6810510.1 KpsF/GutQ family sugar-phosphate isomerase [Planctomycetota bacterium]
MNRTDQQTDETTFIAEALRAEADAIRRIADRVMTGEPDSWREALDLLERCDGHVVVSGLGKSGLIGAKISATFTSLGQPSSVLHPAEAVHGDLGRVRSGDVVMLLSYSGETDEVVNLAAILKADGVARLGISSSSASTLARLSTVHLSLGDLTEACPLNLAPTASTTALLALGDALALALSRRRNFGADDFHRRHPGGMLGAGLRPIVEVLRFKVGRNLPVVQDTVTVRAAFEQSQTGRRPGAMMLVDENGRLSGIFTDADLRRLMLTDPGGMDRRIAEVMTPRPEHLVVDDLVRDAVRLMRENRHDEIPVLDRDGKPVGLVDVQDLIALKVVSE